MDKGWFIIFAGVLALWLVVMAVFYSIRWLVRYIKYMRSDSRKKYLEYTGKAGTGAKRT